MMEVAAELIEQVVNEKMDCEKHSPLFTVFTTVDL